MASARSVAPIFAGTLTEVATKALNVVWYQKWFVHLRCRPEAIGGIVHLNKTGQSGETDVTLSDVILSSVGLQQSFNTSNPWKGSLLKLDSSSHRRHKGHREL